MWDRKSTAAIIALIALGSCLALGQGSTAAISGVVRDATGAVIPGVTITAKHIESGLTRATVNYTSNVNLNGNFFSVVGRRPEENTFSINGVEYIGSNSAGQPIGPAGASGQTLGVDAVREFNLLQHSYGAEYGKRAGGHVSIVTTSGTNQLHGSVFEYLRNSALDARNFFDDRIGAPPFQRNEFGGSLGGP